MITVKRGSGGSQGSIPISTRLPSPKWTASFESVKAGHLVNNPWRRHLRDPGPPAASLLDFLDTN